MSLRAFFTSKHFIIQIVLLILFVVLFVYLSLLFIKMYTHHGKSCEVPDLSGLTEYEAGVVLSEKSLNYSIIDSAYVYEAIPGTVLSQQPRAGYEVKSGRTIYLVISSISPEKVALPMVVDVSLREARSRLENAGLRLGQVEYRPSEFLNLVLDKNLNGLPLPNDTMLSKGTPVNLVVGRGLSNEKTSVPNLLCMYLDEAIDSLYQVGLTPGVYLYDESVENYEDSLRAMIWKQSPQHIDQNLIELGSSVDVWLTIDAEKIDALSEEIPDSESEFLPGDEFEEQFGHETEEYYDAE